MENIYIAINNILVDMGCESFDEWCKANTIGNKNNRFLFMAYVSETIQSESELNENDLWYLFIQEIEK